jgi:hypothetical protein
VHVHWLENPLPLAAVEIDKHVDAAIDKRALILLLMSNYSSHRAKDNQDFHETDEYRMSLT